MKAVIMAGGKGTRLQSVVMTKDIPKPMMPVQGKPLLEYQINSLKRSGIIQIILMIGYRGNVIRDYFKDGKHFDVSIQYIEETVPLGTAGALYYLKDKIEEDFILLFGDLMLDVDWERFMMFHKKHGATVTLYGHPNSHPYDSDVIIMDRNDKVEKIESKNEERLFNYHNFVNAGLYCISPKLLEEITEVRKLDLEKNLIADKIAQGNVYAYRSTEYVKDMGTPDRLNIVTADVVGGIVEKRSLRNKQKAVFLDRDGTINVWKGFLNRVEDFELLPGVAEAIKQLNLSSYLTIVATNQPVVARGECTLEKLEEIHKKMETDLGRQGAYVDDLFFCPHHPHKGYIGEVSELKIDCKCRKPKTGMLDQAAKKYNIDLSKSWYIGDATVDIQTGTNAGMKTILVKTGEGGSDGKYSVTPDIVVETLWDAVKYILER